MVGDREVFAFRVDNGNGFVMTVIEYGATLLSLKHTAESGRHEELTLHYATLPEILAKSPYYGATCGRFANRIAKGTFILDGKVGRWGGHACIPWSDGRVTCAAAQLGHKQ